MFLSAAARTGGGGLLGLGFLIGAVIQIVAAVKILPKAGYSRWYAVLLLIPIVGAVMILIFAFADWPLDRELRSYREAVGRAPSGYPQPPWPAQSSPGYGAGTPPQNPSTGWPAPGASVPPPPGVVPPPGGPPPPWPGSTPPPGG